MLKNEAGVVLIGNSHINGSKYVMSTGHYALDYT